MTDQSILIVPVSVEALCVGKDNFDQQYLFVRNTADFSQLPYRKKNGEPVNTNLYLSYPTVLQGHYAFGDTTTKGPGVYLHWALPDGISRARFPDGQEEAEFPQAPNRWLISRVYSDPTDPRKPVAQAKSWVVESDYFHPDHSLHPDDAPPKSGATVPVEVSTENGVAPFKYVGRSVEVESSWTEPDPPAGQFLESLTVLGYGEPRFAASQPDCPNVFSLHDPLTDLPNDHYEKGRLTYVVVGWHSQAKNDPMNPSEWQKNDWSGTPPTPTSKAQQGNPFQWSFELQSTDDPLPARSVYKGQITDISWNPNPSKPYLQDGDETKPDYDISGETRVAIGNTAAEALAVYIAQTVKVGGTPPNQVEEILNYLQVDSLAELARPGGATRAAERLHQSGFASANGGTLWTVRDTAGHQAEFPADSPIPKALDELNAAQQALDEANEEIRALRQQLFYDWVKYMEWNYGRVTAINGNTSIDGHPIHSAQATNELQPYMQAQMAKIQDLADNLQQKLADIEQDHANLKKDLPKGWEIEAVPAPRYWNARDPVLLLQGKYLTPPGDRYGGIPDGVDGYLRCRLDYQVIHALHVKADAVKSGSAAATLESSQLASLFGFQIVTDPQHRSVELGPLVKKLLVESVFLDPNQANGMTAAISQEGGDNNPAKLDWSALAGLIENASAYYLRSASAHPPTWISFAGPKNRDALSVLGLKTWQGTPWIPIALDWKVRTRPLQEVRTWSPTTRSKNGKIENVDYETSFITANYELDEDKVELYHDYDHGQPQTLPETYLNSIPLSRHTTIDLKRQIESFKKHHPHYQHLEVLKEVEQSLKSLHVMSQNLGGFNDALLMRHMILQMPVNDPLVRGLDRRFLLDVAQAVKDDNAAFPLTSNAFNPIRSGELLLGELRLIDVFGRFKCISFVEPLERSACHSEGWQPPKLYVSQSMQPIDSQGPTFFERVADKLDDLFGDGGPAPAALRPRVTQPSRLLLRWLSAEDDTVEMNSHPASSPVCGWIVHNRLDGGLVFYDAGGGIIGTLYAPTANAGAEWRGAPGTPYFGKSFEAVFSSSALNAHLRAFANGVHANQAKDSGYLAAFLVLLQKSLATIEPHEPPEDPSLAVLFGRPLAIVRAKLRLDLQGLPAFDQSYAAFWEDGDFDKPPAENPTYKITGRQSNGFTAVEFPVRLGAPADLDDGMVGYFITAEPDEPANYARLYAPAGPSTEAHGIVRPALDSLTVCPGAPAKYLTLLLDPRCKVHATTGILPVKELDVPPDQYAAAWRKMVLDFLTAPVLCGARGVGVPLPFVSEGNWKWLQEIGSVWHKSDVGHPIDEARFDFSPQTIREGWLQLRQGVTKI